MEIGQQNSHRQQCNRSINTFAAELKVAEACVFQTLHVLWNTSHRVIYITENTVGNSLPLWHQSE